MAGQSESKSIYDHKSWLYLVGLALVFLYSIIQFLIEIFWSWGDTNVPPGFAPPRQLSFVLVVFILLAYYLAYRLFLSQKTLKTILFFTIIFTVLFLIISPFGSADLYLYTVYPKIFLVYGDNPYTVPLAAYQADDLYKGGMMIDIWQNNSLAYGPVWLYLVSGFTCWALSSTVLAVLAFKLLAAIFFLASVWLVYQILGRAAPERQIVGTALFAWSPLVLFEAVNNGHNDIIMVFLVLLAVWLMLNKKYFWVVPVLVLSVLIKYLTVIFIPFFIIYLWQSRPMERKKIVASIFVSLAAVVLLYAPLWAGWQTFAGARAMGSFTNRGVAPTWLIASAVYSGWGIQDAWPGFTSIDFTRLVNGAAFIYFYFWAMVFLPLKSPNDLFKACFIVAGFIFVLLTVYSVAWYYLLPLALMVLIKDWPWRWLIFFTVAGWLTYFLHSMLLACFFLLIIFVDLGLQNLSPETKKKLWLA